MKISESPKLNIIINGHILNYKLFEALECVSQTWSQREAAKRLSISHAVLNRRIKEAEGKLGTELVHTTGAGTGLTDEAIKLLNKYNTYIKRLKMREKPVICGGHISSGLLENLSLEYGLDAAIYCTDDKSAFNLANMSMVDILTFDDPAQAFMRDLEFIPIAYDHLVLVSGNTEHVSNLNDLNGKKFIEILDSSQRLAWNTLDNQKIQYKIVKTFKSPHMALEYVKTNEDIYTFLNSSYWMGNNIIKEDTKHIISLVKCDKEDDSLDDFIDFILAYRGQKIVEKCGFEKINYLR